MPRIDLPETLHRTVVNQRMNRGKYVFFQFDSKEGQPTVVYHQDVTAEYFALASAWCLKEADRITKSMWGMTHREQAQKSASAGAGEGGRGDGRVQGGLPALRKQKGSGRKK